MRADLRPSSTATTLARWRRAGSALAVTIVIAAVALLGYDAWLWLFSPHALERITGLHLEARFAVACAHHAGRLHPELGILAEHPRRILTALTP